MDKRQLLQGLNEPIRMNDTTDTTTFFTLTTIFFSFPGLDDLPNVSNGANLYDFRKICRFLARSCL
jgi:hypothetical protein